MAVGWFATRGARCRIAVIRRKSAIARHSPHRDHDSNRFNRTQQAPSRSRHADQMRLQQNWALKEDGSCPLASSLHRTPLFRG